MCASVLMARDRAVDRSPDTEKQVKAVFWHLLAAIGLFVRLAQSQAHWCVFPQKRQGKSVWAGLFFCFY